MDATELKKLAAALAQSAVSGNRAPLQKIAFDMGVLKDHVSSALANPTVRNSLLGAGAGGLAGLLAGDEDDRGSKALHYALLGGLSGAGLTAGMGALNKATAPPPKTLRAPVSSNLKPLAKAVGVGAGAAGAAAAAGYAPIAAKSLTNLARRGAMSAAWAHPWLRPAVIGSLKSKVPGEMAKNFGKLPLAGKFGIPAAGAALLYSLLNGSNRSK